MDSLQSVVSPFKKLSMASEPAKLSDDLSRTPWGAVAATKEGGEYGMDGGGSIGVLEVFVHQARDIHNICIYHKQDVYSKVCLTSDPDDTVSTRIINGGGKNPLINDRLHLNVRTLDCSLKCKVWMMSRVKNYLEDQLLGFALVPMSEILVSIGRLEKEFTLSSTDLFHSPAGFVQLSLSYVGASPEVVEIPATVSTAVGVPDADADDFSKMFPDPKVVNETHKLVSEYFGLQWLSVESRSSESYVSSDNENQPCSELGAPALESFSNNAVPPPKVDSPPGSVSSGGSSKAADNLPREGKEKPSEGKETGDRKGDGETDSSGDGHGPPAKPVVTVNVEVEQQKVVQQDIMDMYMKSMQQFTVSLEKMNLPLDVAESGRSNSANSSSADKKSQPSKTNSSRVFYGSRAFF